MSEVREIKLGRLGDTVDEVVIVAWLVREGDLVAAGQGRGAA